MCKILDDEDAFTRPHLAFSGLPPHPGCGGAPNWTASLAGGEWGIAVGLGRVGYNTLGNQRNRTNEWKKTPHKQAKSSKAWTPSLDPQASVWLWDAYNLYIRDVNKGFFFFFLFCQRDTGPQSADGKDSLTVVIINIMCRVNTSHPPPRRLFSLSTTQPRENAPLSMVNITSRNIDRFTPAGSPILSWVLASSSHQTGSTVGHDWPEYCSPH